MGNATSKSHMATEITKVLKQQGTEIKRSTAATFVTMVAEVSPWFLTGGGLNIPDWEQVKQDLQRPFMRGAQITYL